MCRIGGSKYWHCIKLNDGFLHVLDPYLHPGFNLFLELDTVTKRGLGWVSEGLNTVAQED